MNWGDLNVPLKQLHFSGRELRRLAACLQQGKDASDCLDEDQGACTRVVCGTWTKFTMKIPWGLNNAHLNVPPTSQEACCWNTRSNPEVGLHMA